jgi:hypothetical protein
MGLWPLACRDFGFESCQEHGCLFLVSVVCSQLEVSASGWSLIHKSPTEGRVSECDSETSIMRRSWPTRDYCAVNPLNAELNPICHLLILEDLTFLGPCIISIFQYISYKMQRYTVYLYLETVLHVSGGSSTHHQERIHLYLQHLAFVTPLLLSAAIVEELEQV